MEVKEHLLPSSSIVVTSVLESWMGVNYGTYYGGGETDLRLLFFGRTPGGPLPRAKSLSCCLCWGTVEKKRKILLPCFFAVLPNSEIHQVLFKVCVCTILLKEMEMGARQRRAAPCSGEREEDHCRLLHQQARGRQQQMQGEVHPESIVPLRPLTIRH